MQRYRQEQRYYRTLASMHSEGSEGRQEVFESYKKAMYPYIESTGRQHRDHTQELLEEAFLQGPIIIQAMSDKDRHETKESD